VRACHPSAPRPERRIFAGGEEEGEGEGSERTPFFLLRARERANSAVGRGRGANERTRTGDWGLGTGRWEMGYFLAIVFICYRWERLHSVRVSFEPDFLLAIVFLFVGLFV
jgi:hypothetical protein